MRHQFIINTLKNTKYAYESEKLGASVFDFFGEEIEKEEKLGALGFD